MSKHTTHDDTTTRYLRARRLASLLDVSVATVWRWSASGRLPAPHHLGPATTAWRLDEVQAALRSGGVVVEK